MSQFRTRLGDFVRIRFDDDGVEHITVEASLLPPEPLELEPEPSALDALTTYRLMHTDKNNRP